MPLLDGSALSWIVVAIVAAIIEVTIPQFGVIFVSVAAVVTALVAYLGGGLTAQLLVFSIVLAVSLAVLRPWIMSRLRTTPGVPSRTDTLLGRDGIVTFDIDPTIGGGRVNVGGQDWAAHSASPLATGTRVKVVGADGIVLEVTPS